MRHMIRQVLAFHLLLVAPLVVLAVAGCATTPSEPGVVVYPEGKYKLRGDGTTTPYYWVWVPNGSTELTAPAPPPVPTRTAVVVQPTSPPSQTVVVQPTQPPSQTVVVQPTQPAPTVVTGNNGRYQLYGDGAATPYYWVWVPPGGSPPPPPGPPRP